MDMQALCKPYAGNGRTPEGQRTWLTGKKGIPEGVVDEVMAEVYAELGNGRVYASGYDLDQHLLSECRQEILERASTAVEGTSRRLENVVSLRMKAQKVLPRKRARQLHAAWFAAGALLAEGLRLLWTNWLS
jgi:hypothetical protein